MSSDRRSDQELLAATGGDPAAFGVLYRRHVAGMLAYFMRRTADPEVTTDLTAEVFAAALEASDRYDPSRGAAVAWLYGIAHNVLSNSLRRGQAENRARRRLGMEPLVLVDESLARVEGLGQTPVEELLGELPDDQRVAVTARILNERNYGDIAGELRCSASVVRKRVSRGLAALRCQMEERT